jgi:hypothetical protein
VAVVATTLGAACDGSSGEGASPAVQVYVATIRDVATAFPVDRSVEDPPLPIVYVTASGEAKIDAGVQAAVASALDAEIDVRFADARAEAIDEEKPGAPVHADGHLVALGPVDDEDGSVVLEYEHYRSDTEWSRRRATFANTDDVWAPTSTSLVEQQAPTSATEPAAGTAGDDDVSTTGG